MKLDCVMAFISLDIYTISCFFAQPAFLPPDSKVQAEPAVKWTGHR
jgi:hypothetical protein